MTLRPTTRTCAQLCISFLLISSVISCKKDDGPAGGGTDPTPVVPLSSVTVNTNGATIVDEPKVNGEITVVDVDGVEQYSGRIGIEIRGASSQLLYDKKQYGFETRDADNMDVDVAFLSFPEEEDWILYAPYGDKSLIRNHLIYNLARDMGHYASRSELVEFNLNDSYDGLYVFMEKLKRDKNRIDINKLKDDEISGEDLTGGYIIKVDKINGGDYNPQNSFVSNFSPTESTAGQTIKFLYDYPDADEIVPEQKEYIATYMADFEMSLSSAGFADPDTGYASYIDVDSFIDFFILNEFSNNVDGYRLSTFLHKDKNEKLKAGPIWDFNLAFGNADYCDGGESNVWAYKFNERCPDDFWQVPFWWGRFLEDPAFVDKLKLRWNELRGGTLSNDYVQGKIAEYVAQIEAADAARKNFDRWPVLGIYVWPNNFVGDTYASEVNYLKSFIENRLTWLDSEITAL